MPIEKQPKTREPMWHEWDDKAQKKGIHHTVYTVAGDHYTGDWSNNKKNGKLTFNLLQQSNQTDHDIIITCLRLEFKLKSNMYEHINRDYRFPSYNEYILYILM